MKKLICILLAALVLALTGTAAFAETEVLDEVGMTLHYPAEYDELLGTVYPYSFGKLMDNPELYLVAVLYLTVPGDIMEKAMNDEALTESELAALESGQGQLGYVLVTNDLRALAALTGAAGEPDLAAFGEADGYSFFFEPVTDEAFLERIGPDFAEEFLSLQESFPEVLKNAELYAPVSPMAALVGDVFRFETTDLDGNRVTSGELFAQNEITMINYWGTWCPPCRGELAALGEIHRRLRERGCGIIGIVQDADADDQAVLDRAKGLLAENGADYPNLVPCDEMADILDAVEGYPTSFFVDKSGKILCAPIRGAAVGEYESTVLSLLEGQEVSLVNRPEAQKNNLNCYRVLVYDLEGKPVKGAVIRLCTDELCHMGKTDAEGVARFDVEEGTAYTVHVLKVPEGYANDSGEYVTATVYSDVTLYLEPAA